MNKNVLSKYSENLSPYSRYNSTMEGSDDINDLSPTSYRQPGPENSPPFISNLIIFLYSKEV
tara:strand:+ start:244 stop:429 length:186 start_codon:yes stop_codon:yes gene_type:complete